MRESIHKYFKVGSIQRMSCPRMDGMESLKAVCSDDFFDAIEINTNKLGNMLSSPANGRRRQKSRRIPIL